MRVPLFWVPALAVIFLTGCGPKERPAEFYTKAENAAEFAHALEVCKRSGLSHKDVCAAVWQAKAKMDFAEDQALAERAIREMGGTTVVPQSPKQPAVSEAASPRKPANAEAAATNSGNPLLRN